jgi:hypothetical protein
MVDEKIASIVTNVIVGFEVFIFVIFLELVFSHENKILFVQRLGFRLATLNY